MIYIFGLGQPHTCSAPYMGVPQRSISTRNTLQGTFKKISSFRFLKGFDYAIKIIRFKDNAIYIRTPSVFFGKFWR